jgi:hypothetical protein
MMVRCVASLLVLLLAGPAYGQGSINSDCRDDNGVNRCAPAQQARVRALFGIGTIEAHRDAADWVRRVFYVDGYGRDVVAIAFVRRPGHDPEVRVHFPREDNGPEYAPLVAPVPVDVWDLLIERSELFDRADEPVAVPQASPGEEVPIRLCMHSWVYTIEATDPVRPGRPVAALRRRTEDACADGVTGAFAREVYRAALPLFPYCGLLDPSHYRTPANQLAACSVLSGDRAPAARVRNQAVALFRIENIGGLPSIAPLFHYQAQINWNGAPHPISGEGAAARFFLSQLLEAGSDSFFVERVEGLNDSQVRMHGGFVRLSRTATGQFEIDAIAPVELLWEAESRDGFQIRNVTVGPYARLPRR